MKSLVVFSQFLLIVLDIIFLCFQVKTFMLDVLCPLLTEADFISNELLDIILINIVDPYKTQRKNAASLARDLIIKTSSTLEPYIQQFFNQVLILG